MPASPYVLTRPVANEYLVRERDRRRLFDLLAIASAVALVGGALLGYTWIHQEILRTGYSIDRLETHLGELAQSRRELLLEEARLQAVPEVARRAAAELEMGRPSPSQLLVLAADGSSR